MPRLYILPVVFLLMLSVSACDSSGLDAGSEYRVTYTVTVLGESTISGLSYRDGNGSWHAVPNPSMPWSTQVRMRPGNQASLSVDGTVLSGTFTIALRADNGDHAIALNTSCASGTHEVLPKTCDGLNVERRLP